MVYSLVYTIALHDNVSWLEEKYRDIKIEIAGIHLEWNDEGEITLYQNVSTGLVQEDCLMEFKRMIVRFVGERIRIARSFSGGV